VRSSDPETGKPVTKPAQFFIDTDICMNCGFCAEYCPFDAIKMDHKYELSDYEREEGHIYDLARLTQPTSYYASIRPTWNALEEAASRQAEEEKQRKAEEKAAAKAVEAKATVAAAAKAAEIKAAGDGDQPQPAPKPKRTPEEIQAQREAMLAKKRERETQQTEITPKETKKMEASDLKSINLIKVEGIGEVYAGKLKEIGLTTAENLLEKGSTPAGRKEIAEQSDISPKLILRWVNMVDLFRIKGVSEEYSDLLEAAGVDTVPELAQRNPENLYQKMVETNQIKKLVRRVPGQAQVESWVTQAKELPRRVNY
jgi:predicted flap endonuclease-1-like 5' DNA nuclease